MLFGTQIILSKLERQPKYAYFRRPSPTPLLTSILLSAPEGCGIQHYTDSMTYSISIKVFDLLDRLFFDSILQKEVTWVI